MVMGPTPVSYFYILLADTYKFYKLFHHNQRLRHIRILNCYGLWEILKNSGDARNDSPEKSHYWMSMFILPLY